MTYDPLAVWAGTVTEVETDCSGEELNHGFGSEIDPPTAVMPALVPAAFGVAVTVTIAPPAKWPAVPWNRISAAALLVRGTLHSVIVIEF
jgi:hypothetical protein